MSHDVGEVTHAMNPKWRGPLCRYEDSVRHQDLHRDNPQIFYVSQDPDNTDVTCVKCLQRLGRVKKVEKMPGQGRMPKKP